MYIGIDLCRHVLVENAVHISYTYSGLSDLQANINHSLRDFPQLTYKGNFEYRSIICVGIYTGQLLPRLL